METNATYSGTPVPIQGHKLLTEFILFFFFFFFLTHSTYAQKDSLGAIRVIVSDKETKEMIPFANVVFFKKGKQIAVKTTDFNGECTAQLPAGIYSVKGVYVGYQSMEVTDVKVQKGRTSYISLRLDGGDGLKLQEVEIVTYQIPLIDPDTRSGQTVSREDYQNLGMKDFGNSLGVRGSRANNPSVVQSWFSNTETYEASAENIFKNCKKDPLSTFSSDVDAASYTIIRRIINDGFYPPKEAVRIEEMINYFRYQYPAPVNKEAFAVHTELNECPWNKNHQLLQVGVQGRSVEISHAQPNHLTFLIDVSGSMSSDDKLPLLKKGLQMLTNELKEKDKVAIVVYAGNAGLVLESTKGDKKEKILNAIENLEAGGSTAGGEGIELAYKIAKENFSKEANNRVILATDGDFNVGVSADHELVKIIEKKREEGIFLTVLGFGSGNYQDAKMEKLADKGNGNYAYVDNILEAKKVLVKEIGGTLISIAKDVKFQIEFNPRYVKKYRLIGYDNRMLEHEDFNDDKKDAGDVGSGHSVTALYEIIPAGSKEEQEDVDALKYQKVQVREDSSSEVCTIKLRYKEPKENTSKLITKTVKDDQVGAEQASRQFRFCAAVAEMGLVMRASDFKGDANLEHALKMAKESKGEDEEGYRAEFIQICEKAILLANK